MSPSNINSFVGDLVQMAKAMETLPLVEAENERLSNAVEDYAKQVQALELRAIDRNAEINSLHDRIRSLEVERDDASFRVLEVEERTEKLERSFQSALEAMDATDRLIQSFKPVPTPQPVTEPESSKFDDGGPYNEPRVPEAVHSISEVQPQGSSEPNPTSNATNGEPKSEQTSVTSSANEVVTSGESVSPPTSATMDSTTATQDARNVPVGQGVSFADQELSHGPYFGKKYVDVQGFISRDDWIMGGGTNEDYDWRQHRSW